MYKMLQVALWSGIIILVFGMFPKDFYFFVTESPKLVIPLGPVQGGEICGAEDRERLDLQIFLEVDLFWHLAH